MQITPNYYDPLNLVSKTETLEKALQLQEGSNSSARYHPLYCYPKENKIRIKGFSSIYHHNDPECKVIYDFMWLGLGGLPGFPLNLTNSPQNVKFRQDAVKEISENSRLLKLCQNIIDSNIGDSLKVLEFKRGEPFDFGKLNVYASPEKIDRLLNQIHELGKNASCESLRRCTKWADKIENDTLFQ